VHSTGLQEVSIVNRANLSALALDIQRQGSRAGLISAHRFGGRGEHLLATESIQAKRQTTRTQ